MGCRFSVLAGFKVMRISQWKQLMQLALGPGPGSTLGSDPGPGFSPGPEAGPGCFCENHEYRFVLVHHGSPQVHIQSKSNIPLPGSL